MIYNKNALLIFSAFLPLTGFATEKKTTSKDSETKKQPNIVFILSDDAGYADFGFQGSKQFRTPNLDKLAKSGVVLKQMYVADAVSGPSRAALITGKYPQRMGIEENNVPGYMSEHGATGDDMGLPLDELTMADYLHKAGYVNAAFGKWHLGSADRFHPLKRGFDEFVGFRAGGRPYFAITQPFTDGIDDTRLEYSFAHFKEPEKYMTELLADEACKFIEKHSNQPFFIYLAFSAVHTPLQATKEDLDEFPNLTGDRKTLAAMTFSLDKACGQVLDKLRELKLDENTIVIFTNDNGGPDYSSSNYPLSGQKATFLEGGIRVPGIISFPGVIKPNTTYDYPVSSMDLLPTFVKLAGGKIDSTAVLDGVDIIPYLTGKNDTRPHDKLFWKTENRGVVRNGDWKFMRFPDRPVELYDLTTDIGEHNNVADKHPELIKKFYKELSDWEMQMDRPRWMLKRKYEERVLNQYYEDPVYRFPQEMK